MSTPCNLSISDLQLPEFCENVTSGVRRLLFIPKDDIETINAVIAAQPNEFEDFVIVGSPAMTQKAIIVKSGCEFGEISTQKDLGELKYAVQGSAAGNRSFHVTIEIHHPGFRRAVLGFLAIAANLEFVLLAQLSNGDWHLLGDLDRGATLADGVEATSGKAITDQNGATMTFEYDCPLPRIMFSGWSPDDETFGVEMFRIAWLLADENGVVLTDENDLPIEITVY
jgi:hypothetical protein